VIEITDTSVCSLALSKIGHSTIFDIGGSQPDEVLSKLLFYPTRDEVLRRHNWNCAIARRALASLDEEIPGVSYTYKYQLPVDPHCLRVIEIIGYPRADYLIEGDTLLTNISSCNIRFIQCLVNPADWDSMLLWAIVARLAWRLTFRITAAKDLRKDLLIDYMQVIQDAIDIDQVEKGPQDRDHSSDDDFDIISAGRSG